MFKKLFLLALPLIIFSVAKAVSLAQDETPYFPDNYFEEQTAAETSQQAGEIALDTKENRISLDIKGMDIVDVLKMISGRAGMNIVVGRNVTGRVTLFLKDVDIWGAFEIILLANDLAYERKGEIINVMTQRDYELIYGERFQDKKQAKIIQLKYAKAAELSRALNQLKTNIGRVIADEASNTIVLVDMPATVSAMEDFIRKTDLPLRTEVFSLNYAQADKLSAKIQEAITKGVGSLRIDERTNKIAVTDYPEKLAEISRVIAAFDEKAPQVRIEAQIVEISPEKEEFRMGVDWDAWIKKNFRMTNTMPLGGITKISLALAAGNQTVGSKYDMRGVIDLLSTIGKTRILSSPSIVVVNNQEAKILVGKKDAYITSTTSQGASGNTVTAQSVNFVDVGIKLYVTPTINKDEFVTMKIKPEVSSAKMTDITSEGKITQVPIVTTSEAETTVTLKDGTTIMIAGLKKDQNDREIKKIPFLGDIPILGLPFRNYSGTTTKTELVVFITPHIVSGEEPLAYRSLTQDKEIANIQSLAEAEHKTKAAGTDKALPAQNIEDYKKVVFEKITASSVSLAKKDKGLKGEVKVSFVVEASGRLKEEPAVISSSNQGLNAVAVTCVKKASPFPPFPDALKKENELFRVSLSYN
jgi:TonB family protein